MDKIKRLINSFLGVFGYKIVRAIKEEEQKKSQELPDSKLSNVRYNEKLWNSYANNWAKEQIYLENQEITPVGDIHIVDQALSEFFEESDDKSESSSDEKSDEDEDLNSLIDEVLENG